MISVFRMRFVCLEVSSTGLMSGEVIKDEKHFPI